MSELTEIEQVRRINDQGYSHEDNDLNLLDIENLKLSEDEGLEVPGEEIKMIKVQNLQTIMPNSLVSLYNPRCLMAGDKLLKKITLKSLRGIWLWGFRIKERHII